MYIYSERPGTLAAKRYKDDVPPAVKSRRLDEIVALQYRLSHENNLLDVGQAFEVLIEGNSKRSDQHWMGRNSQNKVIIFPKAGYAFQKGDYATVKVTSCSKATLLGEVVDNTVTR
jgi:tRNA-2-methylthio-N6-dimethylallyladenosine synthase